VVFGGLNDSATIGVAQTPVCNHGVVSVGLQFLDGIVRGGGSGNGMTGRLQDGTLQGNDAGFIVNAKDPGHIRTSFNGHRATRLARLYMFRVPESGRYRAALFSGNPYNQVNQQIKLLQP